MVAWPDPAITRCMTCARVSDVGTWRGRPKAFSFATTAVSFGAATRSYILHRSAKLEIAYPVRLVGLNPWRSSEKGSKTTPKRESRAKKAEINDWKGRVSGGRATLSRAERKRLFFVTQISLAKSILVPNQTDTRNRASADFRKYWRPVRRRTRPQPAISINALGV